jgi:hypothetical protein
MENLRQQIERHLTLPELLDALDADYEELFEITLGEFFEEREEDIREILKDYGD